MNRHDQRRLIAKGKNPNRGPWPGKGTPLTKWTLASEYIQPRSVVSLVTRPTSELGGLIRHTFIRIETPFGRVIEFGFWPIEDKAKGQGRIVIEHRRNSDREGSGYKINRGEPIKPSELDRVRSDLMGVYDRYHETIYDRAGKNCSHFGRDFFDAL